MIVIHSPELDKEEEAIQFSLYLQENEDEAFKRLVDRLKHGEKIPNVCLTDRNTVAFFIA